MVRVFIVYDTTYGNTKRVAEKIGEGLREVEGIEIAISDIKEAEIGKVADSDVILIGAPNHIGSPPRAVRKIIDKLGNRNVKAKWIVVFDTYMGGDFEKVVKKMEKKIGEKLPSLQLITSGLSIRVKGIKGPIMENELPKCINFGKKIANQLKT